MRRFYTFKKLALLLLLGGIFYAVPLETYAAFSLSGIMIKITGYILSVGAGLFNKSMELFVLQMGGLITGSTGIGLGIGVSIDIVWRTVRDLVNLTFIFGLVYVGFKTILNIGGDTKKLLASIIIGALLVNFSLFISKVVIDVSNATASQIYRQMGIANSTGVAGGLGLADAFLARMGILQLITLPNSMGQVSVRNAGTEVGDTENYIGFAVAASLFILISAFVFAAGGILIAIRFGVLIILMMLSPIAFAASVFPVFKRYRDRWWNTLFSQAFFAPAYIFMLYLTLVVADGYQTQVNYGDGIYTPELFNQGYLSIAFFSLTIIMMVASLILAKQLGAYGGARAVSIGRNIANGARRNIQSFTGRNTIGLASQGAANLNKRLDNRLDRSRAGRAIKTGAAIATFGALSERTRRTALEAGQKAKFGGSYSRADDIAYNKEQRRLRAEEERKFEAQKTIDAGIKLSEQHAKDKTIPVGLDLDSINALARILRERSDKELENMKVSILSNEHVAVNLNSRQVEALEKSDKFTPQDIIKIKDARKKALVDIAEGDGTVAAPRAYGPAALSGARSQATLAQRGENELAKMPTEVLLAPNMAEHLTPHLIEQIIKDGKANATQLATLKTNIETYGVMLPTTDPYVRKFEKWKSDSTYGAGFNVTF